MTTTNDSTESPSKGASFEIHARFKSAALLDYVSAVIVVIICTLVCAILFLRVYSLDLTMIYLLGIVVVALKGSRGPAILATVLSVASFDYFFVPPYMQFAVLNYEYLVTLGIMFVVSLLIADISIKSGEKAKLTQEAQVQLETQKVRNTLLSSLSHDLRTPLAVIAGAASSLFAPEISVSTRQELAHSIFDQSDKLNRILRNVLDATRLNTGGVRLKKEWHSIEEVIGAVLTNLDGKLETRHVKVDLAADLPLVEFDDIMLEQVLTNIVENAIKYSQEKSPLEISAKTSTSELLVEVINEGKPFAPGDEEKIFDRFYRIKGYATMSGVGLGLAICKAIISMHGGKIWAYNVPKGVCFSFTLPMKGKPPKVELDK